MRAIRIARGGAEDIHPDDNPILKWVQRRFRATTRYDGQKLFTVENGARVATPLFIVLVFIELATKRVHLAGCTTNPDGGWVTQQARNLASDRDDATTQMRFLVRDRDQRHGAGLYRLPPAVGREVRALAVLSAAGGRERLRQGGCGRPD